MIARSTGVANLYAWRVTPPSMRARLGMPQPNIDRIINHNAGYVAAKDPVGMAARNALMLLRIKLVNHGKRTDLLPVFDLMYPEQDPKRAFIFRRWKRNYACSVLRAMKQQS
jgi:hypothetical protein